jgi:hypothetical protein
MKMKARFAFLAILNIKIEEDLIFMLCVYMMKQA